MKIIESLVETTHGAVPVRDYLPDSPATPTGFLWIHGGGFSSGGLDQKESDAPARALATAGFPVRTLAYRLAPRWSFFKDPDLAPHPNRYPAALEDVVAVAEAWSESTGGTLNIGGASAGAALAAAATLRLRDSGRGDLIRSAFLAYSTMHAVLPPNADVDKSLRSPIAKWAFNPTMVRRMNVNYVGDPALLVPGYAFPGGADLHGFPPTFCLDARKDRLRRSGHAFADELRSAGVAVDEAVVEAGHGFLDRPKKAVFDDSMKLLTSWLSKHS